jgi:hypothetical protein
MMGFEAVRLERAERRFRRDIWSVAPPDAIDEAGVRMRWFGPVFASVFAHLPHAGAFNMIQGAAEAGAVSGGYLEEAIEWVRSWEVDYMVAVATGRPQSERAEGFLNWHGYEQGMVVKRHTRPATPPRLSRLPGVEVQRMPHREDEAIGYLAGAGLGIPDLAEVLFIALPCLENWRCYLATLEGEFAATGSMMLDGGIATLGIDATMPWARGRGCNRALLERRLADAAVAGCELVQAFSVDVVQERPSAGTRGLRKAGFEEAGRIVTWCSAGSTY